MSSLRYVVVASCAILLLTAVAPGAATHVDRIQGPFKTGTEVTKACLACHEKEAKEFMGTTHWTWSKKQSVPGKGEQELGKKNAVNNFCLALSSNWPRCTSCHAGYGWKDASFDFSKAENIDCLVCHEATGTYKKTPTGAGAPDNSVDLLAAARSVGKPSRRNCGACHFFGGGGDHIKHGDLDTTMAAPRREYDVHMAVDGRNMDCSGCHKGESHSVRGESLAVSVGGGDRVTCAGCHKEAPHGNERLNRHAARLACATCHVPTFAKGLPTNVWWDWSKAGETREATKDVHGLETYSKMKGEFRWERDIVPAYAWYNGSLERYTLGDKIDPSKVTYLNRPLGSREDPNSRITPFKVMRGKQPYDSGNGYFAVPQLFGGYWKHYDWKKAIEDGMKAAGIPFSGSYGFAETAMYWKINHMVVPKEKALRCADCHGAKGRLDWKALGYAGDPRK
jgi:octaheme c-type cytochrome (tetrathionate reductase family)